MTGLWEKLRAATAGHHRRVEATLKVARDDATLADYVDYLERTWRYFAAIEPVLGETLAGIHVRPRSPMLGADLAHFGVQSKQRPLRMPLHRTSSIAVALGCAYVLEGSTLGGTVLYSRFNKRWGVAKGAGASFLYGYGPDTARSWKAFVDKLDAMPLTRDEEEACIDAARATFETIGQCYEQLLVECEVTTG